ncbi:MAG: FixH family protein [Rhodospirillales bacterium]|nr:FixH family protein [Rhodospirillales bacterium]
MSAPNPKNRRPLWYILGGFSVVLIANGFLVYYALNTWTGLETKQHYAKGLAYNSNIEGAKRQQALGWQVDFTATFVDDVSGTSQVRFTDRNAEPLNDLSVHVLATRPTHEGYDREFYLVLAGDGVYRGAFSLPLKGQWDFRILARRGDENFQRVERIVTP